MNKKKANSSKKKQLEEEKARSRIKLHKWDF